MYYSNIFINKKQNILNYSANHSPNCMPNLQNLTQPDTLEASEVVTSRPQRTLRGLRASKRNRQVPDWPQSPEALDSIIEGLDIILSRLRTSFKRHSGEECVWYCGSCCGCGLKKSCFTKSTFSWGWFEKIGVWLKLWLKLRLKKK